MTLSSKHVGLLALVLAAGVTAAVHAQAVLDKYDATLTVNKMSAATSGQKVFPLHSQRGVGMDGSARSGGVFPWSFSGNSLGGSAVSSVSRLGVIDLATDAISMQEVDLALPAAGAGRWTIGRSFNGRQNNGAQLDSNGPQGYNWFQSSQPEISVFVDGANHANDVVYLVYGADRYIEFRRTTSSSNVYKAKNGAAGVIEYKSGSPDTWEYTDQAGIVTTFFGGNTTSGAADWQVWKITDPAGNTAYVGDATTASTAVTNGYNSDKTISFAYDAAGRRYSYSYTTVGVSRLTQVKAETKTGGTWASPTGLATVGQVDYTYYTTNEAGLGLIGDLKMVTLTTPLSTGSNLVKKKHYRYYDQGYSNAEGRRGDIHQIKLIVGYEGCRNYDWAQDGTLDDDFLTASDADLKSYSDAWFEYENNAKRRITKAFFNGECGCSGGNNGTYTITAGESTNYGTYVGNGSYDNGFATRTVLQRPDSTWATYYFDETGQPLSTLITDTDPGSSPTQKWSTSVTRDSGTGVATRVSTPANNSAFTYSTGVATEIASGAGASLVTPIGVSATTNLVGLPTSSQWSTGTAGTAYLRSSRILGSVTKTIGSGTTVDIVRPTITESWVYTQDTTTEGTSPKEQYVHHAAGRFGNGSYVDSVILRNRDQTNGNNGAADGTLENREYYCQNWRADVSVTMTDTGRILEWLKYSTYGVAQRIAAADFNRDNFVDFFDDGDFATAYGLGSASADINFDGSTNATDNSQWSTTYAEQGGTARGALSQASGVPAVNRIGYAGYWFEPSTQQYLVRYREFDPLVGLWDERDIEEYHDGSDLYAYVESSPIVRSDSYGKSWRQGRFQPRSEIPTQPAVPHAIPRIPRPHCVPADVWERVLPRVLSLVDTCGGIPPRITCGACNVSDNCAETGSVPQSSGGCRCEITICVNSSGELNCPDDLYGTLIHELTHCRQRCEPQGRCDNAGSCSESICREVEAYDAEGECWDARWNPLEYLACICNRACDSSSEYWCPGHSSCESRCRRMLLRGQCSGGHDPTIYFARTAQSDRRAVLSSRR